MQGEIGTSSKTENCVNRLGKGKANNNFANAQHSPGDFITATDYLKSNLKTAKNLGDRSGERTAYDDLGTAHQCLEDFNRTIDYQERQVEKVKELNDISSGGGTACGKLSNTHCHPGDFKAAKVSNERYLKSANELGDRSGDGVACCSLLLLLMIGCCCCFFNNMGIPPFLFFLFFFFVVVVICCFLLCYNFIRSNIVCSQIA